MKNQLQKKHIRLVVILLIAAALMFAFSYALVPLYNVMCSVLGLNGRTDQTRSVLSTNVDTSRLIKIQFLSHVNTKLGWRFYPLTKVIEIHPGQNRLINYFAQNTTDHSMKVQAIASVTPGNAAKYLRKTECFCFSPNILPAGKSLRMPIVFHIDRDLPKNIHELTLSYTLYKAIDTNGAANGR